METQRKPGRRNNSSADDGDVKLIASFEEKLKEKELKKLERLAAEKKREQDRERKRREFEKFQQEIDAMMNDEEDDVGPKKEVKSYVPIAISSVKGRWGEVEKQHQKAEEERAKKERLAREAKDIKDKKKIEKELVQKELEEIENGNSEVRRKSRLNSEPKPKKLNITLEDLEKQREAERQQKLQQERQKRIKEDKEKMADERAKAQDNSDDEYAKPEIAKRAPIIKKLNISVQDLESKNLNRDRKKTEEERRKREELDALLVEKEREKYDSGGDDDFEVKKVEKQSVTVGKIKLDFDQIVQMKTKKEQEALAEGMKEKVGHFRNLRLQTKKYQSDDIRLREEELNLARPEESKVNNPNKLNADKVNLDQTFKEREAAQAKALAEEKMRELRNEIKLMNDAKAKQMKNEMENLIQEQSNGSSVEVHKLEDKFTKFDKLSDEKVAQDAIKLREERMKNLKEEMVLFETQRQSMEDELFTEESATQKASLNVGKLDKSKTSFDNLETQREEARLKELKLLRMDRLKTELGQMEQERQDYVDEIQTRTTSGTRFNPSKMTNNFEEMQKQRQTEEEQALKAQRMAQMEAELDELQSAWQDEEEEDEEEFSLESNTQRIIMDPGKLNRQQLQFDKEHLHSIKISENRPKIEIKKMNTNNIFERMQKEKEDEAERRLEEHRLARSTKERNEMIESKQRELREQLEDSESEESYSDDDMDGSPTFLEPLTDCVFKEGQKFSLACSIAGFPQPKVIWYHNKVPLPNGADYQYKVRGTIYSLNMAEVFREDEGSYSIRAINDKGVDMSECQVKIQ